MKRIDLKKVLRMDFMIQHRCTGTPVEFAKSWNSPVLCF